MKNKILYMYSNTIKYEEENYIITTNKK